MTTEIDEFASLLLEEAKRFLEKAKEEDESEGQRAQLHAALMLGFCSLEAHVNAIADELSMRDDVSIHEKGLLLEQEIKLNKDGVFQTGGLKIARLEERILFMHARFGLKPLDRSVQWWADLSSANKLRNDLVHPKTKPLIKVDEVSRALSAIIEAIDSAYQAIFKKPFPARNRGLQSRLAF